MNPTQKLIEAAEALEWGVAPARIEFGNNPNGWREALLPLGKDNTLRLYAEQEALHLVPEAMREAVRGLREAGEPVALPAPGSPGASAMIDSVLAEHGWPSNPKTAARAGYEAARRRLTTPASAPPSPAPQPDDHNQLAEVACVFYQGALTQTEDGKFWTTRLVPSQPAQDGGDPSLVELVQRFRGWEGPEISGRVRNQKQFAQDGGEVVARKDGAKRGSCPHRDAFVGCGKSGSCFWPHCEIAALAQKP